MAQLHGLKLSVPDQVKVIGFGALNLRDPRVTLSTFDQDPYQIGQHAAKLLVQRMEEVSSENRPQPVSILNKPLFVEGLSCPAG